MNALERGASGAYNVDGPADDLRFRDLLAAIAPERAGDIVWIDEHVLIAQGVEPWSELPLWEGPDAGLARTDSSRARGAGLTYTPLAATIADVARWERERAPFDPPWLSREREDAILRACAFFSKERRRG